MGRLKLHFITVPIGNLDDITVRGLNCLRSVRVLLCEEPRKSRKWLKYWGIKFYQGQFDKQCKDLYLYPFDENSDSREISYFKEEIVPFVNDFGFISGAGCPMFHDPGNLLLKVFEGAKITYIPGVSSLGALLMYLPQELQRDGFRVCGFLPRKKSEREKFWTINSNVSSPIFLMETAYRLPVLCDELESFAKHSYIIFGYALTKDNQQVISGTVKNVLPKIKKLPKEDFVIFLCPKITKVGKHPITSSSKGARNC